MRLFLVILLLLIALWFVGCGGGHAIFGTGNSGFDQKRFDKATLE